MPDNIQKWAVQTSLNGLMGNTAHLCYQLNYTLFLKQPLMYELEINNFVMNQ